jgi:hypothetical protein
LRRVLDFDDATRADPAEAVDAAGTLMAANGTDSISC